MSSYLLTPADCREAAILVRGALLEAAMRGIVHRQHLHVVVIDPTVQPWHPARRPFKEAILYEESFPRDQEGWEYRYDEIARAKAEVAWHTGRPTDELALLAPHLYSHEDTVYYGSVIYRGLIVAASGVKPWYDVAFANMMAGLLVAKAIGKMQTQVIPADADYFHDVPLEGS